MQEHIWGTTRCYCWLTAQHMATNVVDANRCYSYGHHRRHGRCLLWMLWTLVDAMDVTAMATMAAVDALVAVDTVWTQWPGAYTVRAQVVCVGYSCRSDQPDTLPMRRGQVHRTPVA